MYENSRIYTIRCKNDDTLIYVGSTTQPLKKRFMDHKSKAKAEPDRWYRFVENWEDWYIELWEEFPCQNKEQLLKREGEVIREIGTLNHSIAGRTHQEYVVDNKDKIKELQTKYYQENVEKCKILGKKSREIRREILLGKIECECGDIIGYDCMRKHIKTNRHLQNLTTEKVEKPDKTHKTSCQCGGRYTQKHKADHLKSALHKNWSEAQQTDTHIV